MQVGGIYSNIAIVHHPDRVAGVMCEFYKNADFSVLSGGRTGDQTNRRVRKFALKPPHFLRRGIGEIAYAEENFKLRIVLLDLGDESFARVGVKTAEGF